MNPLVLNETAFQFSQSVLSISHSDFNPHHHGNDLGEPTKEQEDPQEQDVPEEEKQRETKKNTKTQRRVKQPSHLYLHRTLVPS
jgi:hypothetical protein